VKTGRRPPSFEDRLRTTARLGLTVSVATLTAGLVLAALGAAAALGVLLVGLAGLVVLPVVNVVEAVAEEVRRRDWAFAGAALAVLAILAYNIYRAFG
jgi:uncharacterized membrane protein